MKKYLAILSIFAAFSQLNAKLREDVPVGPDSNHADARVDEVRLPLVL